MEEVGDVEEVEKEEIRYQINTKNSIERTKMQKNCKKEEEEE